MTSEAQFICGAEQDAPDSSGGCKSNSHSDGLQETPVPKTADSIAAGEPANGTNVADDEAGLIERVDLWESCLQDRLKMAKKGPTLIFDGVCNLCNASMRWYFERLLREDAVYFMWAQHDDTLALLDSIGISREDILKSWAYIENDVVYRGSSAWFQAMQHLCAPWRWLGSVQFVPETLREGVYGVVAGNRYDMLGKSEACQRPDPRMKRRFLHVPASQTRVAADGAQELSPSSGKKRLLVIGCSFSGINIVRALASEFEVTIVEPKDYFEYTPGILRGLCDPEHLTTLQLPLAQIFADFEVTLVRGQVVDLGEKSAQVWTSPEVPGSVQADGTSRQQPAAEHNMIEVAFDYAVIAAGSQYAGHGLWKCTGAPGEEAETSLTGRIQQLTKSRDQLLRLRDAGGTIICLGAGLVGVELAAELAHYIPGLKVVLVDRAPVVLPQLPERAQRYAHDWLVSRGVELRLSSALPRGEEASALGVEGEYMLLGCAGIAMRCSFASPLGCVDEKGAIRVNRMMQIITDSPAEIEVSSLGVRRAEICAAGRIFALGDCVTVNGMAQFTKDVYPADGMADVVIENLRRARTVQCMRTCPGVLREIKPLMMHTLCSLGPDDAIYVWNGRVMATGWVATNMKHQIETTKMSQFRNEYWGGLVWSLVPHW